MTDIKFEESHDYQEKLIANMVFDLKFLEQISPFIKYDYFDLESHQWIVKIVLAYYNKYHKTISFEAMAVLVNKIPEEARRKDVTRTAYTMFKLEGTNLMEDFEFVQEHSLKFCKTMAFKNALLEASDFAVRGDVDKAFSIIQESFFNVSIADDGVDLDDIEHRSTVDTRRDVKSLPWVEVNKRIKGGLAEGEMMVTIAPMGVGKSMLAVNMAAHCKRTNQNMVLFTFEMNPEYNRHRIDSILLDRASDNVVYDESTLDELQGLLKTFKGKVFVKKFPSNTATAHDVQAFIRKLKSKGIKIHWIVLDYMDVMEPVDTAKRSLKEWEKMEVVSRDMDKVTDEECLRTFALAQGNTQSIGERLITAKSTGGGAKRLHPFDAIFGLGRSDEDKVNDTGCWSFIKNRFGKDGFALEVVTDYTKSFIDIVDEVVVTKTPDGGSVDVKNRYEKFRSKNTPISDDKDNDELNHF